MSKKKCLLALVLLSIPAAFVSFYATNLVLSDVANMFYMSLTKDFISSVPIFMIAAECTVLSIAVLQAGADPDSKERIIKMNAVAITVLSLVGAVCAVLSGTVIYDSFTAPYPFPAAAIVELIFHLALAAAAVVIAKKCTAASGRRKNLRSRVAGVIRWVLAAIFVYYAYDRFGAVLWAPVYIQISSLSKTAPFYLSLLLPVVLLLSQCCYRLRIGTEQKRSGLAASLIFLCADLLLFLYVVSVGKNDTQFIAAISPALGIERLLSKPIVTIAHFILTSLPILGSTAASAVGLIKERKNKPETVTE